MRAPLRPRGSGDIAATRTRSGRIADAHSYDDLALELPDDGVPVDLDHDPETRCGELVYGELDDDGRLNVVCVVDGLDFDRIDEDVFWSPTLLMRGDVNKPTYIAREASLLSLALTLNPGTLGARPISWRQGDIRDSVDRHTWPLSWRSAAPLLVRAVDHGWTLRTRTASRIIDLRHRDNPWQLREGQHVNPGEVHSSRLPGGLRRGAPGRVLSVR